MLKPQTYHLFFSSKVYSLVLTIILFFATGFATLQAKSSENCLNFNIVNDNLPSCFIQVISNKTAKTTKYWFQYSSIQSSFGFQDVSKNNCVVSEYYIQNIISSEGTFNGSKVAQRNFANVNLQVRISGAHFEQHLSSDVNAQSDQTSNYSN